MSPVPEMFNLSEDLGDLACQAAVMQMEETRHLTSSFSSHGGTYRLAISSPTAGGILEDGAEVEVWGSHPLTNDIDWDGVEDRYDPRLITWHYVASAVAFYVDFYEKVVDSLVQIRLWVARVVWEWWEEDVQPAMEAAGKASGQMVDWVVDTAVRVLQEAVSGILTAARGLLDATVGGIVADMVLAVEGSGEATDNAVASAAAKILLLVSALFLIPVAIRAAEMTITAITAGVGWLVTRLISRTVAEFVVKTLALTALSLAVAAVFAEVLEAGGWVEEAVVEFLVTLGFPASLFAAIGEVALNLVEKPQLETSKEPSIVKKFKGFGYALAGVILVLFGAVFASGPGLAAVDAAGAGLAILGFWFHVTESRKSEIKALNALSSLGSTFEDIVVYASPPLAGATIGVHIAKGDYNG